MFYNISWSLVIMDEKLNFGSILEGHRRILNSEKFYCDRYSPITRVYTRKRSLRMYSWESMSHTRLVSEGIVSKQGGFNYNHLPTWQEGHEEKE